MKGLKQIGMTAAALLMFLSLSAAGERQGATVIIVKKDGVQVTGELLAVKKTALVVSPKGPASQTDESVDVQDISSVAVLKKSRTLQGLGLGLLIGAAAGAVAGAGFKDDPPGIMSATASDKAAASVVLSGLVGMAIGGIVGHNSGKDILFEISGASEVKVLALLGGLGEEARVRGVH